MNRFGRSFRPVPELVAVAQGGGRATTVGGSCFVAAKA
jgi:hypothetical protein